MMVLDKYRTIPREGFFLRKEEAAYIAGFFDGDGSVRIQLQPRENTRLGFRVRAIISFAQKIGHETQLRWIRRKLRIGYIYTRNDGMSELKMEGFSTVERILRLLEPFVLFKKKQVRLVLHALEVLKQDGEHILEIAKISDRLSALNYVTVKKRYTAKVVAKYLQSKKIYPRND